jgi:hypothetical protein
MRRLVKRYYESKPILVAAPSKAWICGFSLAEISGSNPVGGVYLLSVVCVHVEISLWELLHVQRRPTECGACT